MRCLRYVLLPFGLIGVVALLVFLSGLPDAEWSGSQSAFRSARVRAGHECHPVDNDRINGCRIQERGVVRAI